MMTPPPTPRSPDRRPPPSPIATSFGSSLSGCRRVGMARQTNVWPMSFSTRPELRGTFGMVASTHWLASAAGMAVLEQGGNAFDAADATGKVEQLFTEDWTTSVDVYLPAPVPGALHRNQALAETYRRILAEAEASSADRDAQLEAAHDCWYRGFVGEEMIRFQERE